MKSKSQDPREWDSAGSARLQSDKRPATKSVAFRWAGRYHGSMNASIAQLTGQPVLVVADNPNHRKVLHKILAEAGMDVASVDNAPDALSILMDRESAHHNKYLLVSDIDDNLILLESIRTRPEIESTAFVVLLSNIRQTELQQLSKLGIDGHLQKPFKRSKLTSTIAEIIEHRAEVFGDSEDTTTAGSQITSEDSIVSDLAPEATGIRILLVEDGKVDQQFATAMLGRWGHQVTIANNGREAIELLAESPAGFHLVLMDVMMPEMDGYEATKNIRMQESDSENRLPIVAVTGNNHPEDRQKCLEAGMDEYICKPIRRKDLHEIIEKLVRNN